jgi:hypothetical protein
MVRGKCQLRFIIGLNHLIAAGLPPARGDAAFPHAVHLWKTQNTPARTRRNPTR